MLQNLLGNYHWILGLGGAGVAAAAAALGLPAVLRIIASITDVLAPVARWLVEVLIAGIKDIVDSMATILTVVLLCGGVYVWTHTGAVIEHNKLVTRTQVCESELSKLTRTKQPEEPSVWKFPFNWSF